MNDSQARTTHREYWQRYAAHVEARIEEQAATWSAIGLSDDEVKALAEQTRAVNASGVMKVTVSAIVFSNHFERVDRVKFWRTVRSSVGMDEGNADTVFCDTVRALEEKGAFPPGSLNTPTRASADVSGKMVGEALVALGCVSEDDVKAALATQEALKDKGGVHVKLGVIMLMLGQITMGEYVAGLAGQRGNKWTDLEAAAEAIR